MMSSKNRSVAFDTFSPPPRDLSSGWQWATVGNSAFIAPGTPANVKDRKNSDVTEFDSFRPYLTKAQRGIELNHVESNLEFNIGIMDRQNQQSQGPKLKKKSKTTRCVETQASREENTSCTKELAHSDFELLREDVNQRLRTKLMRSRYFSLNELFKQAEQKDSFEKEFSNIESHVESLPDFKAINMDEFIAICSTDKFKSKAIQTVISRGSSPQQQSILRLCETAFESLMLNKYGNYILQEAIRQSSKMASIVEVKCLTSLETLMKDEYASRVMQILAKISLNFRDQVLRWFNSGLEYSMDQLSAIFLFTSATEAIDCPQHLRLARETIFENNSKRLIGSKYFKRIVMSFVDRCDKSDLDQIFAYFNFKDKFLSLLDDKFSALLINSMIKRSHKPTMKIFIEKLRHYLPTLYETKFFKFFIFRLSRQDNPPELRGLMLDAIIGNSDSDLSYSTSSSESLYYFVHLLISLFTDDNLEVLKALSASLDDEGKLMKDLRGLKRLITNY